MKSITDWIPWFIDEFFPKLTKEESDFIEEVLKWDNEKKAAFMMAKRMFEDE